MAWQLHITEDADGRWRCSHGRRQFDTHEDVAEAVRHLREYAATLSGLAEVVIHRLDGALEKLGAAGEALLEPDQGTLQTPHVGPSSTACASPEAS